MDKAVAVIIGLVLVAVLSVLMGLPVMLLWDSVMPSLFGLSEITFFEAIGLNLLCGLLFKPNMTSDK